MEMRLTIAMLLPSIVLLLWRLNLTKGNLDCEDLTTEECAFAVSTSGARCVLEKSKLENGEVMPDCQTSLIMAQRPEEWIESDECIKGCGLERASYGLSTDALMEAGFADKLCSSECQNNCPNIIDLYMKLAAGEGMYLPRLCIEHKSRARWLIADPVQVAQQSMERGQEANSVWSSTHVMNNKHSLHKHHGEQLDSSFVSNQAPTPQPSMAYGPSPPPSNPLNIDAPPTTKKSKEPHLISPTLFPSSLQSPLPAPSPSPLSSPTYEMVSTINKDFDDEEY